MYLKGEAYAPPPPAFKSGQWVKFEGKSWKVEAATHAHVQLEGLPRAVAAWRCSSILRKSTDPRTPKPR